MLEVNEENTLRFLREYYSSKEYSVWLARIKHSARRIDTLKRPTNRQPYILELYSVYLQLLEILLTNIKVGTDRREALTTLFIENSELRKFYSHARFDSKFYEWFLSNYDFAIKEKHKINRLKKKFAEHEEVLREVIGDYLEDFDFLNAYKHGYRVKALIGEKLDAQVSFISRARDPDDKSKFIIYEREINFKARRVYMKALFITAMLDNLRLILANDTGKKISISHFFITDRKIWDDSFGTSRIRRPLFRL